MRVYLVLICRPFVSKIPGSVSQEELTKCSLGVETTGGKEGGAVCPRTVYSKNQNASIKVIIYFNIYQNRQYERCVIC